MTLPADPNPQNVEAWKRKERIGVLPSAHRYLKPSSALALLVYDIAELALGLLAEATQEALQTPGVTPESLAEHLLCQGMSGDALEELVSRCFPFGGRR